MIIEREDGSYFDPTHLLEDGLKNGFPVDGQQFDDVVANQSAATVSDARHDKGRQTFDQHPGTPWIPGGS